MAPALARARVMFLTFFQTNFLRRHSTVDFDLMLDVMVWWRRRCRRALAAQSWDDVSLSASILCPLRCFRHCCSRFSAVILDAVNPLLLGRPTGSVACIYVHAEEYVDLSGPIQETCPKCTSLRCWTTATMSFLITNSFITSIFHLRSRLVILKILRVRSTAMSKTVICCLWSSLRPHVSQLYTKTAGTRDWYIFTLTSLLRSCALQTVFKFLTIRTASPILLSTSLSHIASFDITPPPQYKCNQLAAAHYWLSWY